MIARNELILEQILYFLLKYSFLTRACLHVLQSSRQYVDARINSALALGLISEDILEIKYNYKKHPVRYFRITPGGLRYLLDRCELLPEEMQWIYGIPDHIKRFGLERKDQMPRNLRISVSAFLMEMAGCEVPPVHFGVFDEKARVVSDYVKQAFDKIPFVFQENRNYHFDYFSIMDAVRHSDRGGNEISSGRETGILLTPEKAMMVYHGYADGMSWDDKVVAPEVSVFRFFTMTFLPKTLSFQVPANVKSSQYAAIMFVQNRKMFSDLFFDVRGKRRKKEFAAQYKEFYIFPISKDGIRNLASYLQSDKKDAKLAERFHAHSQNLGSWFMRNDGLLSSLFPFVDIDTHYAMGVFLDARKIRRLKIEINKPQHQEKKRQFGIICYAWQTEYYEAVLPEIKIYEIVPDWF